MNSKPVFPYGALQGRISSTLFHLGKFDPRDTNLWRLHGDLVGSVVQGIVGPIDLEHSPRIRRMLLDCLASRENVLVDMSAVTHIDGAGAVSLVEVHYSALKNGMDFALFCVGDQVMRVFRLARLDRILTILDCPPEAPVH